jgi:flagellin
MSLVVNTNVASLNAQRSLAASANELKTAMERLSSGKKINSAADDAAGFAIAERMTAQIRGLNMATKNANDGLSMLAVIENATNDVTDMLQRMRELAIQAANDTNGTADRSFLNAEVQSLVSEIDRVANNTQYNGTKILDGTLTNKNIQVGTEAGQTVSFSVNSIQTSSIGKVVDGERFGIAFATGFSAIGNDASGSPSTNSFKVDGTEIKFVTGDNGAATPAADVDATITNINNALSSAGIVGVEVTKDSGGTTIYLAAKDGRITAGADVTASATGPVVGNKAIALGTSSDVSSFLEKLSGISLSTSSSASASLDTISGAIEQVAGQRASYGALQNRLEYTVSNLMNVAEFTTSARSRIEDADFAAESARLAKSQVLQQTGAAMLAQANAQPQLVLGLIS